MPVTCQLSISLDGFVAGPDQSPDNPIGVGGMQLHKWHIDSDEEVDRRLSDEMLVNDGAYIMGRKMFGGGDGPWDEEWKGWWGDDPPYHAPVFVLTHHERDPLPMEGGTTFHFVTGGPESALEQAREAAGDKNVAIAGGAEAARQYLAAGQIDELTLHIAPVLLGAGERLFEDVGELGFEPIEVQASPAATHVKYRVRS